MGTVAHQFHFAPSRSISLLGLFVGLVITYFLYALPAEMRRVDASATLIFLMVATFCALIAWLLLTPIRCLLRPILAKKTRIAWIEKEVLHLEVRWEYYEFVPAFIRDTDCIRWYGEINQLYPERIGDDLYVDLRCVTDPSLEYPNGKLWIAAGKEGNQFLLWLQEHTDLAYVPSAMRFSI